MFDQKCIFSKKKVSTEDMSLRKCLLSVAKITSEMLDRNVPQFTLMLLSELNLIGFDSPESKGFQELHLFSFHPNLLS